MVSNDIDVSRYGHIDVLRGLAILSVVILHVGVLTPGLDSYRYLYAIVVRLNVGMQLFFVLSGFLICASWERAQKSNYALATFFIKRVGKIVPLYIIFLHVNLAIYFALLADSVSEEALFSTMAPSSVNIINYVLHLFFLQGVVPAWLNSLVDGSWSIVAEVYFYLLFPLLLYRFCKTPIAAFRSYLLVLLLAILTAPLLSMQTEGNFGYYNFLYQLPCFMVGVVAYKIVNQPSVRPTLSKWSTTLMAFAGIVSVSLVVGNVRPMGVHNLYGLMFGILLVAMSYLPERGQWVRRFEIIRRVGQQSYAIFFLHLFLLWGIRKIPGLNLENLDLFTAFSLNLSVGLFGSLLLSRFIVHPIDQFFVRIAATLVGRMHKDSMSVKNIF